MANGIVGQIHVNDNDYLIGSTLYGECTTPSGESPKKVVLQGNALYTDTVGLTIHVKFTQGNTVNNNLQLQIRNGGTSENYSYSDAHPIANPMIWQENCLISFTYDGTSWVINSAASTSGVTSITPGNGLINDTNGSSQQDPITSTGTISIAPSGVTNAMLANKTITIAGQSIELGNSLSKETLLSALGITDAIHYIGESSSAITDEGTETPTITGLNNYTPSAGDIVIYDGKEFIWTSAGSWELFGDDIGSYALKTNTVTNVAWNGTANKLTQTINGTTSDVVTISTIKTALSLVKDDVGLGNVTNHQQVHEVAWDATNKKITRSKNGTAGDVVSFIQGTNVTLTGASGQLTIAAADPTVSQTAIAYDGTNANQEYPVLFKNTGNDYSTETGGVKFASTENKRVTINPSTGTITATNIDASIDWTNINGISSESLTFSAIGVVPSATNNATQLGVVQNGVLYIHALSITNTTKNVICKNDNNNTP